MGDEYQDEVNAKMQAQKQYDSRNYGGSVGVAPQEATHAVRGDRQYTLKDEAGKAAEHHVAQANKFAAAHVFLSAHPEFDEFIRLIRSGSIQF